MKSVREANVLKWEVSKRALKKFAHPYVDKRASVFKKKLNNFGWNEQNLMKFSGLVQLCTSNFWARVWKNALFFYSRVPPWDKRMTIAYWSAAGTPRPFQNPPTSAELSTTGPGTTPPWPWPLRGRFQHHISVQTILETAEYFLPLDLLIRYLLVLDYHCGQNSPKLCEKSSQNICQAKKLLLGLG